MIKGDLTSRVKQLEQDRVPFVIATAVRARRPTSVRPGDSAVVLADGTIEGFVGGVCAESTVRLYSLRVLETGEPLLLRLVPGEGETDREGLLDGAVVEHNPCLSGGSLEIFLEPQLPAPRVVIAGSAPIAHALARVAAAAGYDIASGSGERMPAIDAAAAVVVASHGADEERILSEALATGVPYVALVASARRGEAVRESLELPAELRAQLHTPAGLDLGARTPEEIAVAILAEMIAERHARPVPRAPATAVDPICGMEVAVSDASLYLDLEGQRVCFCSAGCRDAYAAQHAAS